MVLNDASTGAGGRPVGAGNDTAMHMADDQASGATVNKATGTAARAAKVQALKAQVAATQVAKQQEAARLRAARQTAVDDMRSTREEVARQVREEAAVLARGTAARMASSAVLREQVCTCSLCPCTLAPRISCDPTQAHHCYHHHRRRRRRRRRHHHHHHHPPPPPITHHHYHHYLTTITHHHPPLSPSPPITTMVTTSSYSADALTSAANTQTLYPIVGWVMLVYIMAHRRLGGAGVIHALIVYIFDASKGRPSRDAVTAAEEAAEVRHIPEMREYMDAHKPSTNKRTHGWMREWTDRCHGRMHRCTDEHTGARTNRWVMARSLLADSNVSRA